MPPAASQTAAATLPPVVADRAATTPPVPAFNRQALWMVLGAFFFASMGVCIKFASAHFSSYEVVGYRGLIGVLFLAVTMRARGVAWRTPVPLMHAGRSVAGVAALLCWFYAISVLPLATSMTLNYMSSVWMAVFVLGAAFLLKKHTAAPLRQQWPLLLAVLLGFAGVVLLLRPTLAPGQAWGAALGLLSGLLSAMAYWQVAALSARGEPESRIVLYFSLGATLVGGLGMLLLGAHSLYHPASLWLLPMGVLAVLGQLCMTRAYASGAKLLVASLQYAAVVFASLYSVWVFGDALPLLGWVGMALIVASGIGATVLRARTV